jgi:glycosyltransferase involved in cell wall biosynthesis
LKILFINSSLEPGKDGVGDYTLRLASALEGRGEDVFCVSLVDRFIPEGEELADQTSLFVERHLVPMKRLSEKLSWMERMSILQNLLDEFQPDWISLQYVPYGFNRRGLPFKLAGHLGALRGNFRWHIMFHELWIGEEAEYTPIQKVIGWLQKRIVRKLASVTQAILHTSNPTYRLRLELAGCPAEILPLFSNISIAPPLFSRRDLLEEAGLDPDLHQEGFGQWIFVLFGAIHPEWDAETLIGKIDHTRKQADGPPPLFILLGRNGREELRHRVYEACSDKGWKLLEKGELSPVLISAYLQCADFGIATSPLSLIGKSGSVAAMLEHGLPVVVSRLEKAGNAGEGNMMLIPLDASFEKNLLMAQKNVLRPGLDGVMEKFLQSLTP